MEVSEANRYTIQEVIGKGSYGVVCSAIDNTNGAWATRIARKGRRLMPTRLRRAGQRVAIKKITDVFSHVSVRAPAGAAAHAARARCPRAQP